MKYITFFLIFALHNAFALDVTFSNDEVALNGPIVRGDADKFLIVYMNNPARFIELDSPGGDIDEALKISSIIKTYRAMTYVKKGGSCASACALVFFAGVGRFASGYREGFDRRDYPGIVGLHRPYLNPEYVSGTYKDSTATKHKDGIIKITRYLENELIPRRLIDEMMSRSSKDIYWLKFADLEQIGNYNPMYEEIFIAKCNFKKGLAEKIIEAKHFGRESDMISLNRELSLQNQCIRENTALSWEDVLALKNKVRSGWRPWNNR